MFKIFAILVVIALPILYFLSVYNGETDLFPQRTETALPLVHIGNVPLRVEVADTNALRVWGLSGRAELPATQGMLFIFDETGYPQIWMKDMLIPIDVIWIDEEFRVVDITENLLPESYPRLFEPRVPVRFAIEVNSNYAESFGIEIGDTVEVPSRLVPEDLR